MLVLLHIAESCLGLYSTSITICRKSLNISHPECVTFSVVGGESSEAAEVDGEGTAKPENNEAAKVIDIVSVNRLKSVFLDKKDLTTLLHSKSSSSPSLLPVPTVPSDN